MQNTIVKLVNKFIPVHSVKAEFHNLEHVLSVARSELGSMPIKTFVSNHFPSFLAYNTKDLPKKFHMILNGHLDVTPAHEAFFKPAQKDGKLYGRGMYDMKAAAAVMLIVFKEVAKKVTYPLGLQLVTDEEIGGYNGTKYQIAEGITSDFVISGDASNFQIVNRSKGFYWLKITAKGKTSHGAYPWEGDNALWKMHDFLNKLQQAFPVPQKDIWVTTVNLAKIETSNVAFNEIPSEATVWLDIRYVPEEKDSSLTKILSLLPKDFSHEFILNEPEAFVKSDHPYIAKLQEAAGRVTKTTIPVIYHHGGSDARLYTTHDMDAIEFGPKGGRLPDGNEWVDLNGLEEYYETLKTFLLSIK